jgi:hypothetical protein
VVIAALALAVSSLVAVRDAGGKGTSVTIGTVELSVPAGQSEPPAVNTIRPDDSHRRGFMPLLYYPDSDESEDSKADDT